MPLEGLKGRRALVTGSSSGIGTDIAKMLIAEGSSVVMVASSPAGKVHTNMLKVHQVGELPG